MTHIFSSSLAQIYRYGKMRENLWDSSFWEEKRKNRVFLKSFSFFKNTIGSSQNWSPNIQMAQDLQPTECCIAVSLWMNEQAQALVSTWSSSPAWISVFDQMKQQPPVSQRGSCGVLHLSIHSVGSLLFLMLASASDSSAVLSQARTLDSFYFSNVTEVFSAHKISFFFFSHS